jgi:hypothetical protein
MFASALKRRKHFVPFIMGHPLQIYYRLFLVVNQFSLIKIGCQWSVGWNSNKEDFF